MKAAINDQGELVVTAESQLEKYALDMWYGVHVNIADRHQSSGSKDLIIEEHYDE